MATVAKVALPCMLWGAGTAMGEIPPYAIAYAFDNQKDTCCNAGGDPDISNGFIE